MLKMGSLKFRVCQGRLIFADRNHTQDTERERAVLKLCLTLLRVTLIQKNRLCCCLFQQYLALQLPTEGKSGQRNMIRTFTKTFSTVLGWVLHYIRETAVAQGLRYCATNRKVAGSIPAGQWIFH